MPQGTLDVLPTACIRNERPVEARVGSRGKGGQAEGHAVRCAP
jgi:hypothetical protein